MIHEVKPKRPKLSMKEKLESMRDRVKETETEQEVYIKIGNWMAEALGNRNAK